MDRYRHMVGFKAIDVYPRNGAAWFNRACALTKWAIDGGPPWALKMLARIALAHARDLR